MKILCQKGTCYENGACYRHQDFTRVKGLSRVGRRVFSNYYKGHMDKNKGKGGSRGGRWVWMGVGEENADNCN